MHSRHNRGRRKRPGSLPFLSAALFIGALICLAVFSVKNILLLAAAALIALGIFLLRL